MRVPWQSTFPGPRLQFCLDWEGGEDCVWFRHSQSGPLFSKKGQVPLRKEGHGRKGVFSVFKDMIRDAFLLSFVFPE